MSAYPVHTYSKDHPDYPEHLATIADAPEILYWRGNAALLKSPSIAVVGTRQSTDYGIEVTRDLAAKLAVRLMAPLNLKARNTSSKMAM